jgi:hypothetical protein
MNKSYSQDNGHFIGVHRDTHDNHSCVMRCARMIHDRHDTLVWIVAQTCHKFGSERMEDWWEIPGYSSPLRKEGQLESEVKGQYLWYYVQTSNA